MISAFLYKYLGAKPTFFMAFCLAFSGSILYLTVGKSYPDFVPFMLLLGKFGLSISFNLIFLVNSIFPVIYSTTTMGLCAFFSRSANTLSPIIAELPAPTPMIFFSCMTGTSIFICLLLDTKPKYQSSA